MHEVELGARRQSCDWEFDSRSEGLELNISEIQEMRTLARMIVVRIRVAILENKLDEAIHWLQTGFAMARHVSQGPILIQSLVGLAFCGQLTKPMEDLIQAPGMPSLYWAMANRPRPFIDLDPALEGERYILEQEFPRLRELDGVAWSLEKSRSFAEELETKFFNLAGWGPRDRSDWLPKVGLAALVAQAYPEAKRALIAQGRPAAEVEAMPTLQVAALYTYQSYQAHRDEVAKWSGLPYYQSYKGPDESWRSGDGGDPEETVPEALHDPPQLDPGGPHGRGASGTSARCVAVHRGDPDLRRDPPSITGSVGRDRRGSGPDRSDDGEALRVSG